MIQVSDAAPPDWRAISRAMAQEPIVFVVGVPRSGTTALRATLDRHPSFRAHGADSPETKLFGDPTRLDDLDGADSARLREYLLEDRAELQALQSTLQQLPRGRASTQLAGLLSGVAGARAGAAAWRLRGDHHRLRVYFHHARRARGVRRLLEKTPAHMQYLREIRATFPRMQAILCIRHPVEVYSSYRKKLQNVERRGMEDRHHWLTISLKRFCTRYRAWASVALEEPRRRPRSVLRVHYEHLTADPPRELARICAFLGEPFEETLLLDDVDVRRDAHGSPRVGGRIVENEKDWREFLPLPEARALEARLAGVMHALGYAPLSGEDCR